MTLEFLFGVVGCLFYRNTLYGVPETGKCYFCSKRRQNRGNVKYVKFLAFLTPLDCPENHLTYPLFRDPRVPETGQC